MCGESWAPPAHLSLQKRSTTRSSLPLPRETRITRVEVAHFNAIRVALSNEGSGLPCLFMLSESPGVNTARCPASHVRDSLRRGVCTSMT